MSAIVDRLTASLTQQFARGKHSINVVQLTVNCAAFLLLVVLVRLNLDTYTEWLYGRAARAKEVVCLIPLKSLWTNKQLALSIEKISGLA